MPCTRRAPRRDYDSQINREFNKLLEDISLDSIPRATSAPPHLQDGGWGPGVRARERAGVRAGVRACAARRAASACDTSAVCCAVLRGGVRCTGLRGCTSLQALPGGCSGRHGGARTRLRACTHACRAWTPPPLAPRTTSPTSATTPSTCASTGSTRASASCRRPSTAARFSRSCPATCSRRAWGMPRRWALGQEAPGLHAGQMVGGGVRSAPSTRRRARATAGLRPCGVPSRAPSSARACSQRAPPHLRPSSSPGLEMIDEQGPNGFADNVMHAFQQLGARQRLAGAACALLGAACSGRGCAGAPPGHAHVCSTHPERAHAAAATCACTRAAASGVARGGSPHLANGMSPAGSKPGTPHPYEGAHAPQVPGRMSTPVLVLGGSPQPGPTYSLFASSGTGVIMPSSAGPALFGLNMPVPLLADKLRQALTVGCPVSPSLAPWPHAHALLHRPLAPACTCVRSGRRRRRGSRCRPEPTGAVTGARPGWCVMGWWASVLARQLARCCLGSGGEGGLLLAF